MIVLYYSHNMVKMNYWEVQIHVLTYFNHNLTLIHYLSHNFQRWLRNFKLKAWAYHRNGINVISNKTVSDDSVALLCYLLKNRLIICSSSNLSLFIFRFFTLNRTQCCKINRIDPLKMHQLQFTPKHFKLNCQKKTDFHQNICLNLWIKTNCLTWTSPLIFLISKLPQIYWHGSPQVDL